MALKLHSSIIFYFSDESKDNMWDGTGFFDEPVENYNPDSAALQSLLASISSWFWFYSTAWFSLTALNDLQQQAAVFSKELCTQKLAPGFKKAKKSYQLAGGESWASISLVFGFSKIIYRHTQITIKQQCRSVFLKLFTPPQRWSGSSNILTDIRAHYMHDYVGGWY